MPITRKLVVGLGIFAGILVPAGFAADSAPTPPPTLVLPQVEVTAQQQAQMNSIGEKTYVVKSDIQGVAGSAADVLQNIPSVQVDIDGNVSLRGDSHVQILIDGRASALTSGESAGDVLSQMPASSIERIEVITNPSAKYDPDGSAGIINVVLKKKRQRGSSATIQVNVGNDRRFGASVGANYNPGPYSIGANVSVRQDDRERLTTDRRVSADPVTGLPTLTQSVTRERFRPWYEIGEVDLDTKVNTLGRITETLTTSYRTQHRKSDEDIETSVGNAVSFVDRPREDPEYERDLQSRTVLEHEFGRKDNVLDLEFRWEHHTEADYNLYTDGFTAPVEPSTSTRTNVFFNEPVTEARADYSDAIASDRKLELGFDWLDKWDGKNVVSADLDPDSGLWLPDPTISNDFFFRQTVAAVYGTYRQAFGSFSAMPGLRLEDAVLHTDQVTSGIVANQSYLRAYPTLQLADDITSTQELQLNFSERTNRPGLGDLNPFSEYQDPTNLRVGNPRLRPEEVHSVELGDQYKDADTTYIGSVFYKYTYNSFTTVSQFLDSTTLLTTEENISHSQAGGVEFASTFSPWKPLTVNASGNAYYNQIDASNLGYSSLRSAYAWTGKASIAYAWSKTTSLQFNANYTGRRLTPQGYVLPSFVANFGLKHEIPSKQLTLVLAVSDLFNSLKEETRLESPGLTDDYTRRRSSRILYCGAVYTFGNSQKKTKDSLQFDNQL